MRRCLPSANRNEDGFVLLTVLWLLVLAGVVGALFMHSALTSAKFAANEEQRIKAVLAASSAIENVAFELAQYGSASRWARHGARGMLVEDGFTIEVEITSEYARTDVNSASPQALRAAFASASVDAPTAASLTDAIMRTRQIYPRPFQRPTEIYALATLNPDQRLCLDTLLTASTGAVAPFKFDKTRPQGVAEAGPSSAAAETSPIVRIVATGRLEGGSSVKMARMLRSTSLATGAIWQQPALPDSLCNGLQL